MSQCHMAISPFIYMALHLPGSGVVGLGRWSLPSCHGARRGTRPYIDALSAGIGQVIFAEIEVPEVIRFVPDHHHVEFGRPEPIQRLPSGRYRRDGVAKVLKHINGVHENQLVIVNDEDVQKFRSGQFSARARACREVTPSSRSLSTSNISRRAVRSAAPRLEAAAAPLSGFTDGR
jgi:hypothetical protein